MTTTDFNARVHRIRKRGPSGLVTPGAAENIGYSEEKLRQSMRGKPSGRGVMWRVLLLAVISGVLAASYVVQHFDLRLALDLGLAGVWEQVWLEPSVGAAILLVLAAPVLAMLAPMLLEQGRWLGRFALFYGLTLICVAGPQLAQQAGGDVASVLEGLPLDRQSLSAFYLSVAPEFLKVF